MKHISIKYDHFHFIIYKLAFQNLSENKFTLVNFDIRLKNFEFEI